jgi:hypothetical protein
LFFLLIAGEELLVPGRFDCEAITAERPHVDRGALDPEEGSRCVTLPWLGLAIGHGVIPYVRAGGRRNA